MYKLFNNIAKGIRLLDKIAIFVHTGKKFIQVRAYERGHLSFYTIAQWNASYNLPILSGTIRTYIWRPTVQV